MVKTFLMFIITLLVNRDFLLDLENGQAVAYQCFLRGPKRIPEVCRATPELPADAGLIPTSEDPTTRELGGLLYPAPLRWFHPALDRSDFQIVYY